MSWWRFSSRFSASFYSFPVDKFSDSDALKRTKIMVPSETRRQFLACFRAKLLLLWFYKWFMSTITKEDALRHHRRNNWPWNVRVWLALCRGYPESWPGCPAQALLRTRGYRWNVRDHHYKSDHAPLLYLSISNVMSLNSDVKQIQTLVITDF